MKMRMDKKYLYAGLTAFIVACCILIFYWVMGDWQNISSAISKFFVAVSPIIYAFVFAFLLAPICNFLEQKCFLKLGNKIHKTNKKKAKKFARTWSVTGALLFGILIIGVLLYMILPRTYDSIKGIVTMMPDYASKLIDKINKLAKSDSAIWNDLSAILNSLYDGITKWLNTKIIPNMGTLLTGVSSGVVSVFRVVFNTIVGLIITAYLLFSKEYFIAQLKKITYCIFKRKTANSIVETGSLTYELFGNYISARIVDSFIIGVLCYIGMIILKIPEPVLISVIVGITNIIPFFGPFIGAIPSALLLLLEDPIKCLVFVIFIFCLQQLDGNLIGPFLLGESMGLNKFWVMLALLVGGMYGFLGMICAVPLFAVVYTILRTIVNNHLIKNEMPFDTKEYMNLYAIDEKSGKFMHGNPRNAPKAGLGLKKKRKSKKEKDEN